MNRKLNILAFLLLLFSLTSCFKEDERVEPHKPGDVKTAVIALGQYYASQVYFDLGTGNVVATNNKDDYDLNFESTPEGYHIRLNTSRFMTAADAGAVDFASVTDTSGLDFTFDKSDGSPDSLALGNWINISGADTLYPDHVYVIDLGIGVNGNPKGFRKMMFTSLEGSQYTFRASRLDGTDDTEYQVTKVAGRNYVQFSFAGGGKTLTLEPPPDDWDLLFTQYTTMLYTNTGEPYPYIVTGVLMNPGLVSAARDTIPDFAGVTIDLVQDYTFLYISDLIGWDWKYYDFDAGSYSVDPSVVFLIRDTEGLYYKMRFIGFYNNSGEKGYPTIEYQSL